MTIKEIETLSGMTRANIRFYEAEGLLTPLRGDNGYRNYSENDLEVLKRIKLLRTLHISLEDIKSLHKGENTLPDVLKIHLEKLEEDRAQLEGSEALCEVMRGDGAQYDTLDAQHYLGVIEQNASGRSPELKLDELSKVRSPVRRFFARELDMFIYSMLWMCFLVLVFNVNISNLSRTQNSANSLVGILLMLFIEPALLARFGTTAGKWLCGLGVTDIDDKNLSYTQAFERTWSVFRRGMGLCIPIFVLVRLWKSCVACEDGEVLPWENDSLVTLRDERPWRAFAVIGAFVAVFYLLVLSISVKALPKHRGDISVAQFSENYNRLSNYFEISNGFDLGENGKWVDDNRNVTSFELFGEQVIPEFVFTEENGVMTGMEITVDRYNVSGLATAYTNEIVLSILSFAAAQKEHNIFTNELDNIIEQLEREPFEDFWYRVYGVYIGCDYDVSGFDNWFTLGGLWAQPGVENEYHFSFEMRKE